MTTAFKFTYTINYLLTLLIGISATLTGIGISRFAFSALMPELIMQHWFTAEQTALLSSANLLGHFTGAVLSLNSRLLPGKLKILIYASLIVSLSYLACIDSQNYYFFLSCRFFAGVAGVVLMILTPPIITSYLPDSKKIIASPIIFSGIGIGVLLSAIIIPKLSHLDLYLALFITGLVALLPILFIVLYKISIKLSPSVYSTTSQKINETISYNFKLNKYVFLVFIAYFADAICFVPHTIFWVDYLSRYVQLSSEIIAIQWGILGFGAIIGPYLISQMVKLVTLQTVMKCIILTKGLAIIIPYFSSELISITISSFIVGSLITGVVATTASLLREYDVQNIRKSWAIATLGFSLFQALSGYLFSYLYVHIKDQKNIFLFSGLGLIVVSFLLIIFMRKDRSVVINS